MGETTTYQTERQLAPIAGHGSPRTIRAQSGPPITQHPGRKKKEPMSDDEVSASVAAQVQDVRELRLDVHAAGLPTSSHPPEDEHALGVELAELVGLGLVAVPCVEPLTPAAQHPSRIRLKLLRVRAAKEIPKRPARR